jgi:hypothetical protein
MNYSKSSMVLINLYDDRLQHLAATSNCVAGSMPFTYLSLPLSTSKTTIEECMPLVHREKRRLISVGR